MKTVDHARRYLEMGFSFIPVRRKDKKPDVSKWEQYQKRLPKREEVEGWFSDSPDRNIAVVCGDVSDNLFVLDCDTQHMFNAFAERHKDTLVVKTTRGGHIYLKGKEKAPYKTSFENLKIDLQGNSRKSDRAGSYVVAPSSIHESGHRYEFVGDAEKVARMEKQEDVDALVEGLKHADTLAPMLDDGKRHNIALGLRKLVRDNELDVDVWRFALRVALFARGSDKVEDHLRVFDQDQGGKEYAALPEDCYQELVGLIPEATRRRAKRTKNFKLAQELMAKVKFLASEESEDKDLWMYHETEGIWKCNGKTFIKKHAEEAFGDDCTVNRGNEVIGHVVRSSYDTRERFDSSEKLVNLRNGVLDPATMKVVDHDAGYYFTYRLPITYDEDARCPKIEKFFEEVLDSPEDVETMKEWFGYCLLRSYLFHKFHFWYGSGRNGKSVMKKLLEAFLGKENVSSVGIQQLNENTFAPAELYLKLANVCGDLPDSPLKYTGIIKDLTGGDKMTVERKHRDPFQFTNYAKCVFIGNKLPEVYDRSTAWWQRLCLITFSRKFLANDKKTDPHLIDKLTTEEELSGLLNVALEGLQRLLERKAFEDRGSVEESYLRTSSTELAFMIDCLEADDEKHIQMHELYQAYCGYGREKGRHTVPLGTFTKKLYQYANEIGAYVRESKTSETPRQRVWKGITWNPSFRFLIPEEKEKEQTKTDDY